MNRATAVTLVAVGVATGALVASLILKQRKQHKKCQFCQSEAKDRRARLPSLIILVRHGESEGNADHTLWRTKPDNLVELTDKGIQQARDAGTRIEQIFQTYEKTDYCGNNTVKPSIIQRVHLIVSPFERTLQTAACLRPQFEHRVVRTEIESRIREQEFGNLQGDEFQAFREMQRKVGRFWYRFPTGESGADVYDRVKSWWFESVLCVNDRVGYDPVDALVVATHGLTMRFVLMQLYSWSPTTFHSVWNADNCNVYVLRKDLQKPGMSPYVLEDRYGDMPRSSIDLMVELTNGETSIYKLEDYLGIPPPRTTRLELVKEKLEEQHSRTIRKEDIVRVTFMPIVDGKDEKIVQGTSSSGRKKIFKDVKLAQRERSCRLPNFSFLDVVEPDPKELRLE
jgi:broad specificity phosphatase PhoE